MDNLDLVVNGETKTVRVDPRMPLLWVLRDELGLTGTKYGCGIGLCGACTVHVDGRPVRSCLLPVSAVRDPIETIEGIGSSAALHVVQKVWIDEQVAQCGYCQPGQIMTAVALLAHGTRPTDEEIDTAFDGNLCRCGTYARIRRAIKIASATLAAHSGESGR